MLSCTPHRHSHALPPDAPRPRHGNPCALAVGPWFTRADRRQDVSLKTPVPRSPPRPHRPRNIARRHVSQRCAGPRGLRLRGTLPLPAAPTQRDTHLCCTLFHIAAKSLESHGFVRPWPVQHAQRGCFTRLRRTAPAPRQGLCNRPRRHGASCFTDGDGGVRHRDDPGTPHETSPPGMFHYVAWARPGPGRDAGDKGGCRLGQGPGLAAPARPVRRCNPDPRVRTGRVLRPSSHAASRTTSDARGGPGIRPSPPARRC